MASLLAIYGDNRLCKKMMKVLFMISVHVIKHSEARLTSKNGNQKNLLSCLEALYYAQRSDSEHTPYKCCLECTQA